MNKLIIPAVIVAIGALSPGAFSQAPNPDAKTCYTTPRENDASRVVRLRAVTFPPRADSGFHRQLVDVGSTAMAASPADKLIADKTEKWGKVVRAANIKL